MPSWNRHRYSPGIRRCLPWNPSGGTTQPNPTKAGAYSWLKSPRYGGVAYEVGALARMWINGDYRRGISVMDRHQARSREASKIAHAMLGWLGQLNLGYGVFYNGVHPYHLWLWHRADRSTAWGAGALAAGGQSRCVSLPDPHPHLLELLTPEITPGWRGLWRRPWRGRRW